MKRKIPWFWRRQTSCPDCGYVYGPSTEDKVLSGGNPITCPRCNAVYTHREFWDLNYDKYSNKADV